MSTQAISSSFGQSPLSVIVTSRSVRLMSCIVPAAAVTYGLFLGMRALIATENFVLPERTVHTLEPFYEQIESTESRPVRPSFVLPDVVLPPEMPPIDRLTTEGKFEGVVFHMPRTIKTPEAAREFGNNFPKVLDLRELRPVSAPVVTYPANAVRRGLEGRCDVRMDVTPMGRPYNVRAVCSDRVFVREAERAVSKVEFIPKLAGGQRVGRKNVVYPVEFQLPD